jgi:hypothetical protein
MRCHIAIFEGFLFLSLLGQRGSPAADSVRSVPACQADQTKGIRLAPDFGFGLTVFQVAQELILKKVTDVDFEAYYISYGRRQELLSIYFGLNVGGEKGPANLNDAAIEWSKETWRWTCDKLRVPLQTQQWKGVGSNGRLWRHVNLLYGFASYENVTQEAAAEFDKVFDSICCECASCTKEK